MATATTPAPAMMALTPRARESLRRRAEANVSLSCSSGSGSSLRWRAILSPPPGFQGQDREEQEYPYDRYVVGHVPEIYDAPGKLLEVGQ